MLKKIRQYCYIRKIRKEMFKTSILRFLTLNTYQSQAAQDLLNNKISEDFYTSVFCGGDMTHHYTEVNTNYILSYKF
jgi:hypothetical protein